jgi:hypothetical protein
MESDRKCSKCGRSLEVDESSLCPKCSADRANTAKTVGQVVIGCLAVAGTVALMFLTGGKFRGPRA